MNTLLTNILYGINSVIGSYGWSMILFTLIVKLLMLPLPSVRAFRHSVFRVPLPIPVR